jgi:hypothetical protein
MGEYAGESIAKKVARVRLYRRTREAWKAVGKDVKEARVMFLPGPEAAEVGALRHILGVPPEHVVAIDRDAAAVQRAQEKWPGLHGIVGDLCDPRVNEAEEKAVRPPGKCWSYLYSFIHLDLMGNLSRGSLRVYHEWIHRLDEGGVLAATYLRGREVGGSLASVEKERARKLNERRDDLDRDARRELYVLSADFDRAMSHLRPLQRVYERTWNDGWPDPEDPDPELSITRLVPIGTYAYRAEVSPMGVLVTQGLTVFNYNQPAHKAMRRRHDVYTTSVIRKDPMIDLLTEADSLEKEFTKQQVAEILNVTPGTLASYRAHRTMGTYAA